MYHHTVLVLYHQYRSLMQTHTKALQGTDERTDIVTFWTDEVEVKQAGLLTYP